MISCRVKWAFFVVVETRWINWTGFCFVSDFDWNEKSMESDLCIARKEKSGTMDVKKRVRNKKNANASMSVCWFWNFRRLSYGVVFSSLSLSLSLKRRRQPSDCWKMAVT